MKKTRIGILSFIFVFSIFYQPHWVYNNFWAKADFYDQIPFNVPYFVFLAIYSVIATFTAELVIRFIKKYA